MLVAAELHTDDGDLSPRGTSEARGAEAVLGRACCF